MLFKASGIALVIPGAGAASIWPVKPQSIRSGVLAFAVDHPSRQTNVFIPCPLVKIRLNGGFKTAWPLKHHLLEIADSLKIQAIASNTVDADIADHQHAEGAFSFRFRSHQSG